MKKFLFMRRFSYFDYVYTLATIILADKSWPMALVLFVFCVIISLVVDFELEKK